MYAENDNYKLGINVCDKGESRQLTIGTVFTIFHLLRQNWARRVQSEKIPVLVCTRFKVLGSDYPPCPISIVMGRRLDGRFR